MSNYTTKATNPSTGEVEEVTMLDDYFGKHEYGVLFPDGKAWKEDDIEFVDDENI